MKANLGLLAYLFDNLPLGLVVLDGAGRVVVYNRAEEKLAGRSRDRVIGKEFFKDVAPCMNVRELGGQFYDSIGTRTIDTEVEMSFPFPHLERPRDVKVRLCSFEFADQPLGFLMVEDVSLQRAVQRMREQLQSLLVHDFKNPLMAVEMNLQLLEELQSIRDTPDAMEGVREAMAAAKRLGRMTLDLLDISRLETAQMPLRRTVVDVRAMFARVIQDNLSAAKSRHSHVEIAATTPTDITCFLDEDLFVRALNNLVENAIRHAAHVWLEAEVTPTHCVLRVIDDGPGVPEHLRARLFDKYVQVTERGVPRSSSNRGLGLTFVKLVAREHGGDAEVACPSTGGTTFSLLIPRPEPSRQVT